MLALRQLVRSRPPIALRAIHTTTALLEEVKLTEGEQAIITKLTKEFSPIKLEVADVSGGCGSFYAISLSSKAFEGLSTLKQHRLVTKTLKEEIEGIHGLQLKTTSS